MRAEHGLVGTVAVEQHDVAGARLEVAAVEVGVGAVLLHDEDLLPQPPHVVRRARGQVVEARDEHPHRRNSTTWVKARRASGISGSRP
jgi:hypothetical protein